MEKVFDTNVFGVVRVTKESKQCREGTDAIIKLATIGKNGPARWMDSLGQIPVCIYL